MIHTDALREHIVSDINIFVKVRHLFAGFGAVFVLVFLCAGRRFDVLKVGVVYS